ncbi:MAG: ATP-dependent helicase HrpB [Pseudomonadota bacterium]
MSYAMVTNDDLSRLGLPICEVLDDLEGTLNAATRAVLVAPPGAGKTTVVPLALHQAEWRAGGRILVLEPRRIAARAAAGRMAQLLGEQLGGTVGVRARFASKVGPKTEVEIITEGVFTRMIIDDPALEGVAAVIFDEFHERSIDSDLGLALALEAQAGLREDLRILVMSATLDGARVACLLGDAPVVTSEGRSYPVITHYLGRARDGRAEQAVVQAVQTALREETGSILVFLPGQGEILRMAENLERALARQPASPPVIIAPLYGAMSPEAQDIAIMPPPAGQRKIVLATAIAETSLTIEGVRVVIDAGLARVPRYDAGARVTRLETVRVSRASADQRRGRAGRTEPGVCYRLWHEPETQGLRPFEAPEIVTADLTSLLIDCAAWGVADVFQLPWIDPPPAGNVTVARAGLERLGAIDASGRLTRHGKVLRALAMPPHLAAMVIGAVAYGQERQAAEIAALLVERGIGGRSIDLDRRWQNFRHERSRRSQQMRDLSARWSDAARRLAERTADNDLEASVALSVAGLLALAFPDRIAKRRSNGRYLLASGRGARLDTADPLAAAEFLVVAELQGSAAASQILAAAGLDTAELEKIAGQRIEEVETFDFDPAVKAVRARRIQRLEAIKLSEEAIAAPRDEVAAHALARGIAEDIGIHHLPWSKAQIQLRARVGFLRAAELAWPDLSDAALKAVWQTWLAPFLIGKLACADITADDLAAALDALIPWEMRQRLDKAAPTHFIAPTGNRIAIDYSGEHAPSIAVRVQELYGLKDHPAIAGERLPLTLYLLSPAQRPIQVTRDLPGFWAGSWRDVKAEMKGRYPRHVWPDDPANALPTVRAKPRS